MPVPCSPGVAAWLAPPEIRLAASRPCPDPTSRDRAGSGRSGSAPDALLLVGGVQLRDGPLEVDHVACQQRLHLARDRIDRVARLSRSSPSAAGSCGGDPLDRIGAELERLDQPSVGVVQLVGMVGALARCTSCSASARSALTWVWTSSASERLGLDSRVNRRSEIWLEPAQRPHVRGVVLESPLLAAVQAAVDAEDEQDHRPPWRRPGRSSGAPSTSGGRPLRDLAALGRAGGPPAWRRGQDQALLVALRARHRPIFERRV